MRSGSECVFVYLELYTLRKYCYFDFQIVKDGRTTVINLLNETNSYDEFLSSLLSSSSQCDEITSNFLFGFYHYLKNIDKILK